MHVWFRMTREDLVKQIGQMAHDYMRYSGCSQSVLLALQEGLRIGNQSSFKAATVLSGGVARRGETCGALLGALMALGLVVGREKIENTEQYYQAVGIGNGVCDEFQRRLQEWFKFKEPLESTLCREIQRKIYGRSFNLSDPLEREAFRAAGGQSEQGCPKVCELAAYVSAERLLKQLQTI